MGNCTDACANKGEQEEVLAAKNKEAGYMVGAASQGDLDVPSAHQLLLDGHDPAKPTLEKPPSFAQAPPQHPHAAQEQDEYFPLYSHPGPTYGKDLDKHSDHAPPQDRSLHRSRVEPPLAPAHAPENKPQVAPAQERPEARHPAPLERSAAEKQPEKPATQQSSNLGQSQRQLGSSQHQLPPQPAPAQAPQPSTTTPQTSELQYRDGFYIGEAEQGAPHGQGSFTNGNYTYTGAWVQGQMHGKCTVEE